MGKLRLIHVAVCFSNIFFNHLNVEACSSGYFLFKIFPAVCQECEPGRYCDGLMSRACPAGTAQPNAGQSSCTACPPNTFTSDAKTCATCPSSTPFSPPSSSSCYFCPINTFWTGSNCAQCPAGTESPMNSWVCLTKSPTTSPTMEPSINPTISPSSAPSTRPTPLPTSTTPTLSPTYIPPTLPPTSIHPSFSPTYIPPTLSPTSIHPSFSSTFIPPALSPTSINSTFLPTIIPSAAINLASLPTTNKLTLVPSTSSPTTSFNIFVSVGTGSSDSGNTILIAAATVGGLLGTLITTIIALHLCCRKEVNRWKDRCFYREPTPTPTPAPTPRDGTDSDSESDSDNDSGSGGSSNQISLDLPSTIDTEIVSSQNNSPLSFYTLDTSRSSKHGKDSPV